MADEWVVIRHCNWLHEAQLIKSVLEAEEIDVQIPDEHTHGVQPGIGAVRVLVRSSELEGATAVLDSGLLILEGSAHAQRIFDTDQGTG